METGQRYSELEGGQCHTAQITKGLKRGYETMAQETDIELPYEGRSFTFLVGPKKIQFDLNVGAVAAKSSVLDRMMNGSMSEAIAGRAELPEVDRDTFKVFAKFCYEEDYRYSYLRCPLSVKKQEILSHYNINGFWCANGCRTKTTPVTDIDLFPFCSAKCSSDRKTKGEPLCPGCGHTTAPLWGTCTSCAIRNIQAHKQNYRASSISSWLRDHLDNMLRHGGVPQVLLHETTSIGINMEMLMSHARVFVFAETYDVPKLRHMSIVRMTYDLSSLKLTSENADGFVTFVEYVCDNTQDKEMSGAEDTNIAKKIVIDFAAANLNTLMESAAWRDLAAKMDRALILDLMNAIGKRSSRFIP